MLLGIELIICCRRKQLGPGPLTTTTTTTSTTTTTTTTATDNRATHQGGWGGEMRWGRRRESAPNTRRTARTRYGTHGCLFASQRISLSANGDRDGQEKNGLAPRIVHKHRPDDAHNLLPAREPFPQPRVPAFHPPLDAREIHFWPKKSQSWSAGAASNGCVW